MALRNNPFKPILKKIPAPVQNKYFLVLLFFCAWLIFFDRHDVLTQFRLQQTLNRLKMDKVYYEEKIEKARKDKKDIEEDKEKFAREHYYMKKDDEDVFIFVEKEE